jgi:hypothetical protein
VEAMTTMDTERTRWSDDRIDDLKMTVDDGFHRMDESFTAVNGRVDQLHHTMVVGFIALATLMVTGFGILITLFALHF